MPVEAINKWKTELAIEADTVQYDPRLIELRHRLEAYADRGYGECHLRNREAAEIVQNALFHFDGSRYHLIGWCIMPNHLHVIIEPKPEYPLEKIVHSWKSYTALQINKLQGKSGSFWERDYHDRFIRDGNHLTNIIKYVDNNLVKAGRMPRSQEYLNISPNISLPSMNALFLRAY